MVLIKKINSVPSDAIQLGHLTLGALYPFRKFFLSALPNNIEVDVRVLLRESPYVLSCAKEVAFRTTYSMGH